MLSYRKLLALVFLASYAWAIPSAAPHYKNFKVKESLFRPPVGWTLVSEAPANHMITLRIGLPQSNFDTLERHLYEVSDPDHARYGQHLSKEEVEELVAPPPESLKVVNGWLKAHGFKEVDLDRSPAKDWVSVSVPVQIAEQMLGTKYHIWKHEESGDRLVRTTSYSLPAELHDHVDVIQPTTMFSRWNPMASTVHWPDAPKPNFINTAMNAPADSARLAAIDPTCGGAITVSCLQQLYNIGGYVPKVPKKNSIGITGFLEQYANEQDLQSFYKQQVPAGVNSTFKFVSVAGGLNNQAPEDVGVEANLDVQFAFGLSHPTPGTFWSTGGRPPFKPDLTTPSNTNEPYADWVDFVLKQKTVPYAISTSYGEPEQTVPPDYARRVCRSLAQLGARGVSLLYSSGDGGVGDNRDNPKEHRCYTNDARNITRFLPTFPAACPYVTAVGGTTNIPEISVYFSGGGFSDYWPRPAYQEKHVKKWFKTIPEDLYKDFWNKEGRAFPDVAAQGTNFQIWIQGFTISIGGTSASSPAFAAIVALLNDARLAKGLPPLGFLNPVLYAKGYEGLNDITGGHSNPGCGTTGFNSTVGWDPGGVSCGFEWNVLNTHDMHIVTGLGTPDFQKLKKILA